MYFQVVHSVKRSGSCCKQRLCMHEFYSPVFSLLSVWLILLRLVTCIEIGSVGAAVARSSSAKKREGHYSKNRKMKQSACIINVQKSSFWLAYTNFLLICLKTVHIFSFPQFHQHLLFRGIKWLSGERGHWLCAKRCQSGRKNRPETVKPNESVLRLGHGWTPSIWDPGGLLLDPLVTNSLSTMQLPFSSIHIF